MKIPSIAVVTRGFWATLRRWPLTILLAVVTSVLLMRWIDHHVNDPDPLFATILGCYVTMLLTIAATIFAETRRWGVWGKTLVLAIALALAFWFYATLPAQNAPRLIRFLVVVLALHWLVAFLPYAGFTDKPTGFWDYNRKLLLRGLQTLLYTVVLYAGVALALLAVETLFDVNVGHAYDDAWWVLAGIFNPIFFLAGFPSHYGSPVAIDDYPRGLKVFTQFVLLPIVTVYLAILYAYLFKIVFTAHWPSGWVTYMVLGLAVAGILALLLIYPLRDDPGNRWIRSYSRAFYVALFPLIVLLWLAIWKRVTAYGITELRYYVLLLSGWLAVMAAYFVLSSQKDIRLIPASLCLLATISLFGPWSASAVSLAAQKARMKTLLIRKGLFADGKVVPAKGRIPLADRKQLSAVTDYLVRMHSYRDLQPWYRPDLDSVMKQDSDLSVNDHREMAEVCLKLIGIKYAYTYETEDNDDYFHFQIDEQEPVIRTTGVAYLKPGFQINALTERDSSWNVYSLDNDSVRVRLDSSRHVLEVAYNTRLGQTIDLRPLERRIRDSIAANNLDSLPPASMILNCPGYRLVLVEVDGAHSDSVVSIAGMRGYLLVLAASELK